MRNGHAMKLLLLPGKLEMRSYCAVDFLDGENHLGCLKRPVDVVATIFSQFLDIFVPPDSACGG